MAGDVASAVAELVGVAVVVDEAAGVSDSVACATRVAEGELVADGETVVEGDGVSVRLEVSDAVGDTGVGVPAVLEALGEGATRREPRAAAATSR